MSIDLQIKCKLTYDNVIRSSLESIPNNGLASVLGLTSSFRGQRCGRPNLKVCRAVVDPVYSVCLIGQKHVQNSN